MDWFLNGIGRFFPNAAHELARLIPPPERSDLLRAYHARLTDPDPAVHIPFARAWANFESACSALRSRGRDQRLTSDRFAIAVSRIEAHYFMNDCFLAPDQLLVELDRIKHLPCHIVQGRYDMICPPETAVRLADAWPRATLEMVEDAGHSALEPGIRAALVRATDRFGQSLRSHAGQ